MTKADEIYFLQEECRRLRYRIGILEGMRNTVASAREDVQRERADLAENCARIFEEDLVRAKAELDRMRPVFELALNWPEDTGGCLFCDYANNRGRHDGHCPLAPTATLATASDA